MDDDFFLPLRLSLSYYYYYYFLVYEPSNVIHTYTRVCTTDKYSIVYLRVVVLLEYLSCFEVVLLVEKPEIDRVEENGTTFR